MLEIRDYIDMVMLFIAGMVDRCCGMTEASVTRAFMRFDDLHQTPFQYSELHGWSKEHLLKLSYNINNFQKATFEAFSTYQPSSMRTRKWHAADHLLGNLRDMGNISTLHAELYESAHKIFETLYMKSAKDWLQQRRKQYVIKIRPYGFKQL